MPPPIPPESESEPQEPSDSESVHTIEHVPLKIETEAEAEESSEASDSTAESAAHVLTPRPPKSGSVHVTGVLANKAKRKAAPSSGDSEDHTAKTRRTEPSEPELTESDSDDDDDDEDIPASASYSRRQLLAHNHAAALALYRQTFPNLERGLKPPRPLTRAIAYRPVKQIPVVAASFNDRKPQNVTSFLMQATGDALPEWMWCRRCTNRSGIYTEACVVVRDPDVLEVTGGACANCWYGRQGSLCSFREKGKVPLRHFNGRLPGPPRLPGASTKQTPVPVLQTAAAPSTRSRPTLTDSKPAPAPLHPSYVAALSSGTAPAVVANNSSSSAVSGTTTAGPSREDKVRVWENRYGSMNLDSLLAAHEHLADWQEDLTTRLIAMNRVVIKKLREREGS
ncbi:hypothetical protein C8A03DRAFT_16792 [Achaetomium macrosporum]|uniref:Uncharacterized protein n=1 Tax=Achaetomium macrosporum TaxID=79813 RepID=A0AAN7C7T8_9PEZI|nr:hypothetical protein C8A03DRAFT_16792 [Achaetomium macrosporum]